MLKSINAGWRVLGTGFCFACFGIGGLFLGLIVIPLVTFMPGSEEACRNRVRWIISSNFKFFFGMMHYLGLVKYRVVGKEILAEDKGCLVIANHPSLIDVVSLISIYPQACCIVKKELWNNFFLKRVVSGAGYIPNDEPEKLLENCAASLARGDVLIIFPEGTRTVPGKEMELQRGAAHIALRLKCPIRTIQIRVWPSTLTKNRPWYKIPERRSDFVVTAKDFLKIDEFISETIPMSLAARQLTRKMKENINIDLPTTL